MRHGPVLMAAGDGRPTGQNALWLVGRASVPAIGISLIGYDP